MKQQTIRLDRNEVFALLRSLVVEGASVQPWQRLRRRRICQRGGLVFPSARVVLEEYLLQHRTLGAWCATVLHAFPKGHRHFTFRTSGSQGVAKAHKHRAAALREEISGLARLFPGRRRIVTLVAPHHI